eukprot:3070366-Pyramimonas_sp.AAC.1
MSTAQVATACPASDSTYFDDVADESDLESWDNSIRRATHTASHLATRAPMDEWVTIRQSVDGDGLGELPHNHTIIGS